MDLQRGMMVGVRCVFAIFLSLSIMGCVSKSKFEEETGRLNKLLEDQKVALDAKSKEIAGLQEKVKALEKTQGELNQISAKFNECSSALQAKSAENAAAATELNKLKEQLANQTSAQASLQKDLDSSKASKDAAEMELRELKKQMENLKKSSAPAAGPAKKK